MPSDANAGAKANVRLFEPGVEQIEALSRLGAETFEESHGAQYSAEDLDAFVNMVFSQDAVSAEWRDERYAFCVASSGDELVGYCKLGPASDEIPCDIELKQIFLRRTHYGSGIALRLLEWAFEEARSRKAKRMGLSVWEENERAIRFYDREGFERVGRMAFVVGEKVETDIVMVRQIR